MVAIYFSIWFYGINDACQLQPKSQLVRIIGDMLPKEIQWWHYNTHMFTLYNVERRRSGLNK